MQSCLLLFPHFLLFLLSLLSLLSNTCFRFHDTGRAAMRCWDNAVSAARVAFANRPFSSLILVRSNCFCSIVSIWQFPHWLQLNATLSSRRLLPLPLPQVILHAHLCVPPTLHPVPALFEFMQQALCSLRIKSCNKTLFPQDSTSP